MKKIMLGLLTLVSISSFAGGIQDRKTGDEIKLECLDENCQTVTFVETTESTGLKSVLSNSISKEKLILITDEIAKTTLDNKKIKYLTATQDGLEDFEGWFEDGGGAAILIAPAGIALLAAYFVVEGTYDLGHNGVVGISNGIKTFKLNKFFKDQLRGDGEKVITIRHKNYLRLKKKLKDL